MLSDVENKIISGVNFNVPVIGLGACDTFLQAVKFHPNVEHIKSEDLQFVKDGVIGVVVIYPLKDLEICMPNSDVYRVLNEYGKVIYKSKAEWNEFELFDIISKDTDGKYWYYHLKKKAKPEPWWKQ
jgi:hypothetical protein